MLAGTGAPVNDQWTEVAGKMLSVHACPKRALQQTHGLAQPSIRSARAERGNRTTHKAGCGLSRTAAAHTPSSVHTIRSMHSFLSSSVSTMRALHAPDGGGGAVPAAPLQAGAVLGWRHF